MRAEQNHRVLGLRASGVITLVMGILIFLSVGSKIGVATSNTTAYYHVTTGDIFPDDLFPKIYAAVEANFSANFGTPDALLEVDPSNSVEYSISATSGTGNLSLSYDIDRPLVKRSGNVTKELNSSVLLGDSPPIPVYDDTLLKITVVIHAHLKGNASVQGPGYISNPNVEWASWKTTNVTVSANLDAQPSQYINVTTSTAYVVYFTVEVTLKPTSTVISRDSDGQEVSGSPDVVGSLIPGDIHVIPEFPTLVGFFSVMLTATLIVIFGSRSLKDKKVR